MSETSDALDEIGHKQITIGEDVEYMADQAIEALAADDQRPDAERFYQRGGRLVSIVRSEVPGEESSLIIRVVALATLYERLSAVAEWGRIVADKKDPNKTT